jgi:hypothetical protein
VVFVGLGIVAGGRKGKMEEKRKEGEEKRKDEGDIYFRHFGI